MRVWIYRLLVALLLVAVSIDIIIDKPFDEVFGKEKQVEISDNETTNNAEEAETETEDELTPEAEEKLAVQELVDKTDDLTLLEITNKKYALGEDYVPDNLVYVDVPVVAEAGERNMMREVAADALKELFDAAQTDGLELYALSGYRSYETQVQIFNNYAASEGEEAANRYSAKPGESEHQTGLTMDVTSQSYDLQLGEGFGDTEEGKWLKDHAHEAGFIIRYPEGKEDITGYVYEPWHIRYLGKEMATYVYESGLTYEEYAEEMDVLDELKAGQ